jgi:hypothetical protein
LLANQALLCNNILHLLLLLRRLQDYLTSQPKAKKVKVDAYLFGAPNVGDSAFASAFNQLVNARR